MVEHLVARTIDILIQHEVHLVSFEETLGNFDRQRRSKGGQCRYIAGIARYLEGDNLDHCIHSRMHYESSPSMYGALGT